MAATTTVMLYLCNPGVCNTACVISWGVSFCMCVFLCLTLCFILLQLASASLQRLWMVTLQAERQGDTISSEMICRRPGGLLRDTLRVDDVAGAAGVLTGAAERLLGSDALVAGRAEGGS